MTRPDPARPFGPARAPLQRPTRTSSSALGWRRAALALACIGCLGTAASPSLAAGDDPRGRRQQAEDERPQRQHGFQRHERRADQPRAEAPRVEGPRAEGPRVEAPRLEGPRMEGPRMEGPRMEGPRMEGPRVEGPRFEAPRPEAARPEAPRPEAPRAQAPDAPRGWGRGEERRWDRREDRGDGRGEGRIDGRSDGRFDGRFDGRRGFDAPRPWPPEGHWRAPGFRGDEQGAGRGRFEPPVTRPPVVVVQPPHRAFPPPHAPVVVVPPGGHGPVWTDHRYGLPRVYPAPGWSHRVLPIGASQTFWHGEPYHFHGGVWYRPGGPGWVVVRPPRGIVVRHLPDYRAALFIGGLTLFYLNGVYYRELPAQAGYEVVDEPDGLADAPPERDFVYPARGQSAEQQAEDEYQCHRWAVHESGFDPVAPLEGRPAAEATRRDDYRRARTACLTARGYTVR